MKLVIEEATLGLLIDVGADTTSTLGVRTPGIGERLDGCVGK